MADITLGQFYQAIQEAAREATLEAVKALLERGDAKVSLTGQTVTIGGTPYELDPPRTLYGPAGSRPNAAAAHAAVPYAVYVSVDTKVIEMTDGTAWRRWGVV